MKVTTSVIVDIDVDAWAREYHVAGAGAELEDNVRRDVESYIQHGVTAHLASLGLTTAPSG